MSNGQNGLQFSMGASTVQLERALARAEARTVRTANAMEKELRKSNAAVSEAVARSGTEIAKTTEAMGRFGNMTGNQRFIIQNTAAQFGDMAVQLGMGTSALTVMGQQLPQILGPIGVMGALLGVAAAILAPLANYMLNAGSGADTMKKSIDALNAALETSKEASELARGGIGSLLSEFGRGGKDVQDLVNSLEQISIRQLSDQARGTAGALTSMYDGSALMNRSRREDLAAGFGYGGRDIERIASGMEAIKSAANVEQQLAAVTQLRQAFLSIAGPVGEMTQREYDLYVAIADTQEGLTKAAQRIKDGTEANNTALTRQYEIMQQTRLEAAEAAATAGGMLATQQQELALAQAIATFGSKSAEVADMRAAAERTALEESLSSVEVAQSLKAEILAAFDAKTALAGVDASVGLAKAADQATKIANELARAVGNAINLAANASQDLEMAKINYEFRGDPTGRARAAAGLEFDRNNALTNEQLNSASGATATVLINAQREAFIAARVEAVGYSEALSDWSKAQSGAAKSGAKEYNEQLRDAKNLLAETRTPAEQLAHEIERINALAAQFPQIVTPEVQKRAISDVTQELGGLQGMARETADSVKSAFTGLFDDPADALNRLAGQLAEMLVFAQLAKAMPSVFGASGYVPLVANANGGVYSGPGINAYSGQIVDKPTIFPFAKGAGLMGEAGPEAILPLARSGGKLGVRAQVGGGGDVQVNIINSGTPIENSRQERRRGPSGEDMIDLHINESLARGKYDKAMGGRYGQAPNKVSR